MWAQEMWASIISPSHRTPYYYDDNVLIIFQDIRVQTGARHF